MKRCYLWLGLPLFLFSIFSCTSTADFAKSSGENNERQAAILTSIDSFSVDQLFAAGGGGCGMSLWKADANEGLLFFNGIEKNSAFKNLRFFYLE